MAKKRLLFIGIFTFLFCFSNAHEFWLEPEHFILKPGDNINVRFLVGENFEGEIWGGNNNRINFLQAYFSDGIVDLKTLLSDKRGDSLQLTAVKPGNAMIVFNSTNSFISMTAEKFNAYLVEDGLQNAIEFRKSHNESDSTGREYYQRSVKTLLQIGDLQTSMAVIHPTDLPLDIIPETSPFLIKEKKEIRVSLFFKKKPLKKTLVKIWHRVGNKTESQDVKTDNRGSIKINIIPNGKWMISAVKMVHADHDPKAQWQSYWGSCTWGYY